MAASKTTESVKWEKADKVSKVLLESFKPRERDLGLAIAIGIRTGLRKGDLLSLRDTNLTKDGIKGKASKTGKEYIHALPAWLIEEIKKTMYLGSFYSRNYSHIWLNRSIQRVFPKEYAQALKEGKTLGAHSLRKAFGLRLYDARGVNAARQGLQHTDTATTARYLDIPMLEQMEIQRELFG